MLFSSLTFVFGFLPMVLFLYYICPKRLRNFVLLVFSLFFYAYGGPKFLIVMLVSIFINYILGIMVDKYREEPFKIKVILFITVFSNLMILIYFKYTNFIVDNISRLLDVNMNINQIVLPIGISFFTFQAMSYVIDVYKERGEVQKNPLNVALYICFFPQLIAGPIVRYETVSNQIRYRKESIPQFVSGIERFIIGLSKKVIIANSMGLIADEIFEIRSAELSIILAWIGAIAYSSQIYFDFSGYSDMAIGLGRMFGFEFLENFNYPYISKSISEFWRRWHISLGTWFRDYVYIPIGGSRGNAFSRHRNLLIVWILTGLWHGASWTFISWGLYFGIIIAIEKAGLEKLLKKMWIPLQHLYTLILVIFGWVLFRSPGITYAINFIKTMIGLNGNELYNSAVMYYIHDYRVEFIIMILACIPFASVIKRKVDLIRIEALRNCLTQIMYPGILGLLLIFTVMNLVNSTFNPFIYFRF
ncbi:AlgI protein [Clostridium putrefaciens]|uniref:AlgI protein n=1 Tax=Clostridium putrefaciens TaxID=99675 RepID=A0A381J8I9_9CLOT|nr:MBOAT family O-acyltransferase [Clostridium putrefaciens]SUY47323.1 AlgI protein [Clostridium putrefaciens]